MDCPCKDCKPPKRCLGCHSTCELYTGWKKQHDEEKKVERQQLFADYLGNSWKENNYAKSRKCRKYGK